MKKFCLLLVVLLTMVVFVPMVQADSVTLEWTANSEPDLVGYRVFVRDWNGNYDYTNPAWQGTATTCIIDNLDFAKMPTFVARAYDIEGYESGNSNEAYVSNGPPVSPGGLVITHQGN